MTYSDIHTSTQTLCLLLVEMCGITERSVYYSTRAFQRVNAEMIAGARDSAYEVQTLHADITAIAGDLLLTGKIPGGRDLRFVTSSIRICDSLYAVHKSAVEIASNTMRLWGNEGELEGTDLPWTSDGVNRLVECCALALTEENIGFAEIVLGTEGLERDFVSTFHHWYESVGISARSQANFVFAIARGLAHIVHHVCEMAEAIVFWMGDKHCESLHGSGGSQLIDRLTSALITSLEAEMPGQD